MPGTGSFGGFTVAPGAALPVKVALTLNGAPYLEPITVTPLLRSQDSFVTFRLVRSTLSRLQDNNAIKIIVENPPSNNTAQFTIQFGWFTP
jgi:hypothetical protein